jgi:hypothetical protein
MEKAVRVVRDSNCFFLCREEVRHTSHSSIMRNRWKISIYFLRFLVEKEYNWKNSSYFRSFPAILTEIPNLAGVFPSNCRIRLIYMKLAVYFPVKAEPGERDLHLSPALIDSYPHLSPHCAPLLTQNVTLSPTKPLVPAFGSCFVTVPLACVLVSMTKL